MKKVLLLLFGYTKEEIEILYCITAARKVQDYLWGDKNTEWDFEEWKRMIRKRVVKLDEVEDSNPHKSVEIRKRILQISAVSINFLVKERSGFVHNITKIQSNLPQYKNSSIKLNEN